MSVTTRYRVAELEGALLDAAVAKALGWRLSTDGLEWQKPAVTTEDGGLRFYGVQVSAWAPSTNWQDGGPIIERERIAVLPCHPGWEAFSRAHTSPRLKDAEGLYAPTPLIAAMRAYVASEAGEEVELP